MLGDGVRNGERNLFAGEGFENLGFGEVSVVEDDGKNLWVTFGEEGAGDPGGAAAGERDFLAERKLSEAGEELFFGHAFEFGRRAYGQCQLGEIHQVEVFDEAHAGEARRVRMEGESALDAIIFDEIFTLADFLQDFNGKIFAVEQEAELRFVEGGIIEESEQDVGGVVMQENCEVVAGGGEDLLFCGIGLGHGYFPADCCAAGFADDEINSRARRAAASAGGMGRRPIAACGAIFVSSVSSWASKNFELEIMPPVFAM